MRWVVDPPEHECTTRDVHTHSLPQLFGDEGRMVLVPHLTPNEEENPKGFLSLHRAHEPKVHNFLS